MCQDTNLNRRPWYWWAGRRSRDNYINLQRSTKHIFHEVRRVFCLNLFTNRQRGKPCLLLSTLHALHQNLEHIFFPLVASRKACQADPRGNTRRAEVSSARQQSPNWDLKKPWSFTYSPRGHVRSHLSCTQKQKNIHTSDVQFSFI